LQLGALIAAGLPLAWVVLMGAEYRRARITAFIDPWEHSATSGYQLIQSWVAFRSGGFFGTGLGESSQKLFFLPAAHTDFILSVLAEEFGLLGVIFVVLLFAVIVYRGVMVCLAAPDLFGRLLGMGLAILVGMQAGINM
ncbi:MAG TPA: stage V sporulation protein E, partial [Gemmatimonadetes bacterium]|nr:stage V sporulation protein E [Gemmatimonadota bacterium]